MINAQILNTNRIELEEEIICFLNERFIPKYFPTVNKKNYEIQRKYKNSLEIELEKEKIFIYFYFYDVKGILKIQADVAFYEERFIETSVCFNLKDIFEELMKLMLEDKIKRLFLK
jgi:hypothetical protein